MDTVSLADAKAHLSELVSKADGLLIVCFDARFVTPVVIVEIFSNAVEVFVMKVKHGEQTSSMWTQVDLSGLPQGYDGRTLRI